MVCYLVVIFCIEVAEVVSPHHDTYVCIKSRQLVVGILLSDVDRNFVNLEDFLWHDPCPRVTARKTVRMIVVVIQDVCEDGWFLVIAWLSKELRLVNKL